MEYYVDLELIRDVLHKLALKHWARFEYSREQEELDASVFHGRIALGLCHVEHPRRSEILNSLGMFLYTRFEQYGGIEDLEEAIQHHRAALRLLPEDHHDRPMFLILLAASLQSQFEQRGQSANLDEAIEHQRAALQLCPVGHPNRSMSLNCLASSLQARFEQHGLTTDLDEAIELNRAALQLRPDGHPNRSTSLINLAAALATRFSQNGRAADLDEAIEHNRIALQLLPDSHPNRSKSLNNLGDSLRTRFAQYGRAADLDEAIELNHAALQLCPEGNPDRSMSLHNLATSLQDRFEQHGQTADLDDAIEHHRAALHLRPDGHPDRSASLNNLAVCLQIRFEQLGRTTDLDEAIKHHRAALQLRPASHPYRAMSLNNLAASLVIQYEQHGRPTDLDEAIELNRFALQIQPDSHPDRSTSLFTLAASLQIRFEQTGQVADLDEAIEHNRSALQLLPDSHANHLDEAIKYHRLALQLRPTGHPDRSMSLTNLAASLQVRSEQHGQTNDLDEAIDLHHAALQLRPDGHPNRSISLNNLATSLKMRFDQLGRTADLDGAIEMIREALQLRPDGHPDRSTSLASLAISLFSQFKKSGSLDDFEECMQLFGCAAEHKFSSSVVRIEVARRWADLARSHAHHTTSRAYKVAMLLLQRSLVVSPTLHTQHDFLTGKGDYRTLTLEAVAYAIHRNRLEEAIELLEQGRGILWSQMRGLRTPLDRLVETNRELADKFRNVSRQLEKLATSTSALQSDPSLGRDGSSTLDVHRERLLFEEKLKVKKQLSNEQEEIINEIRRIPKFESFLTATPFKELQRSASEGPVIVVNHSKYRSDALIILSREVQPVICVPLDGEFYKDSIELYVELLETRQRFTANSPEYDKKLVEALEMLWDRVVSKVVEKLKELGIAEGSRIWWCPTSVLSALPFHAAGPFKDTDGTTEYLLDKYVSSYTPTLGALVNAQSGGDGGELTVLVIGDTSLKSAKQEIRNIRNCGISTRLLVSKKISHEAVIKALSGSTWVHFVCHGTLDPKPFNYSFKLTDHGLTLLDIVRGHIPNAEFAFLSACHTAEQSFLVAHDEVLHLAAAMQFSGFRSVIGSMWELLDEDGPFFAKTVYEYMQNCNEGEAKYKRAAAGLREAAIGLKARDGIQTERWVNLIHIGA
ncbi:TPR-like protein [Fomitiporia mediterranea MF3/22]|uniref:TPR-like protein n=1 Tax=Fomitiporia mediterranea (strain MF3/22) TaxID=694068 RepID=R7SHC2_FOMME|nr:TPR-like protein [Fomitiporia mediterranea MF3/22]EJC97795.1 TPR-like protein [Fomitiporia mediterranea MF3/22]